MNPVADLTAVAEREARRVDRRPEPDGRARRPRRLGPWWLVAAIAVVAWSLWDAGVGRDELVNPGGWPLMRKFWAAAWRPQLSGGFAGDTLDAALVTVAFAVLGTAVSVLIGLVGGVMISETWWRRDGTRVRAGRGRRTRLRRGWLVSRAAWSVPRGIHETVWGLFLVNVLGRDPMVGIFAIAIPFGAITAKVFAEIIDDAPSGPYDALRDGGASRLSALLYGVGPRITPDLVSYGFYRLECSIRSAVILGMIGAGGLGFQLTLSFQALEYREMWTVIYATIAIAAVADWWGSRLRRGASADRVKRSLAICAALIAASLLQLRPDVARLWSSRTWTLVGDIVGDMWPMHAPRDGWDGLVSRAVDTFQMSVLAIALGGVLAVAVAVVAARGGTTPPRRIAAWLARLLLLVTRAIPPSVWALLVLFVLFPGPLPGAVALGVYNFGILGRLCAEVVENLDRRPAQAIELIGAARTSVFAYATLPLATNRFLSYTLYRWEVAMRETVVVGVVGAGGLGRLLDQQRAAFDYGGMLATVLTLLGLSIVVDAISTTVRRSLR